MFRVIVTSLCKQRARKAGCAATLHPRFSRAVGPEAATPAFGALYIIGRDRPIPDNCDAILAGPPRVVRAQVPIRQDPPAVILRYGDSVEDDGREGLN